MNKDECKITSYDKFKCIADKCEFTCCEGWDIAIDEKTISKWKSENLDDLLSNSKSNGDGKYIINKDIYEGCSKLDCNKLCKIVLEYGDDYLSVTCRSFPRISNNVNGTLELSLSCACPEVVRMIDDSGEIVLSNSENLVIRDGLLKIINSDGDDLDKKLIICYEMLSSLLYKNNLESINEYCNIDFIKGTIRDLNKLSLDEEESMEELNGLFLDITENYKCVNGLSRKLIHICDLSEEIDIEESIQQWRKFKYTFNENSEALKKCIISKIYSNCSSDNIFNVIKAFQLIVLEYSLIRYSIFLRNCLSRDENIDTKELKDYIVIFSRIIENNTDGIFEFIEDGFGTEIMELGYLTYISLF